MAEGLLLVLLWSIVGWFTALAKKTTNNSKRKKITTIRANIGLQQIIVSYGKVV